jgi:hypothetical protein
MKPAMPSDERYQIGNRTDAQAEKSQSIDRYAEGEERIVEASGIRIAVRFVGRKGRRGRIAITAPPGAAFRTRNRNETVQLPDRSILTVVFRQALQYARVEWERTTPEPHPSAPRASPFGPAQE